MLSGLVFPNVKVLYLKFTLLSTNLRSSQKKKTIPSEYVVYGVVA